MRPHKYFVTNVLFDDEEDCERFAKYDKDGRLKMLEERHKELKERKDQVLQSSLQSTKNALEMLRESEDIGISAGAELVRQGETLQQVNVRLDEIAADLQRSERHVKGVESVFHALKNRITGKCKRLHRKASKREDGVPASLCPKTRKSCEQADLATEHKLRKTAHDSHPTTRLHGLTDAPKDKDSIQSEIEENLEEMVSHVARLKDIGLNMGQEIGKQNSLIDVIQVKIDNSQCKIDGQTKRIKRINNK